ncbi:MAG: sigma 54-interacting transcriptional regulator [candidate division Zixibacteria bacterium]|nr:sigma 54-interacting transcriptional regulator [candidate division Zixibacteria bacterium]
MQIPSQKYTFDKRLLAVEELLRQRQYQIAQKEFALLKEQEFEAVEHELGLFLLLQAEIRFYEGVFRKAVESGLMAARILAGFPLNRHYGRVQLTLAKAYSQIGDLKNAEIRARDGLAEFRRAGDMVGQIDSLNELARIAFYRGNFSKALEYLDEAIEKAVDNPRKLMQLTGNAAMTRVLAGQWHQAETDLIKALNFNIETHQETAQVNNLLSLGYLYLKRREFNPAARNFEKALKIIEKLDLKWEKVIYLEFCGELALDKGDIYQAKNYLYEAYKESLLLSPSNTLVSQSCRLLAEVELALDYVEEAMKYGQKALEVAQKIGERAEVGMAYRVIARVYAIRSEHKDALEYIQRAVEILRDVDFPFELARTLLVSAEISQMAEIDEFEKIQATYDEVKRLFKRLKTNYWLAETDFKAGIYACQRGNLSRGFKKLSRAEKTFAALGEKSKARAVNQFVQSMADQAIALSISDENEFKIFGNLITRDEVHDLKTGQMEEIMNILLKRTGANRAIIYYPDYENNPVISSFSMSPFQVKKFAENIQQLLGQEISLNRPTLLLDCRRDPYINDLFPDDPDLIASIIVVPMQSHNSHCFLYLDKKSDNNTLNPFSQTELNFAVGFSDILVFKAAEMQKKKLIEDNRRLKAQLMEKAAFPNIITQNSQMLEVLAQVNQVIDSNISISIEGETGCGKDVLARAIHYNSCRRDKRFISVNCAALPETLLESELFGYKRGAFTGAASDKPGLFEEADGGTFFFDEIADMPLTIQAKILRVLEEKEIVRLGESVPRKVDVRIISATNKNLREEMKNNYFRQDLFYRLTALTFRLPPLRDRKEDIPLLVEHFLEGSNKEMTPAVMKYLVAYDWPGNVRELENEIKKLVLLTGGNKKIETDILSRKIIASYQSGNSIQPDIAEPYSEVAFNEKYSLYDFLSRYEKMFIIKALKEYKGIKKHAAASLNIPESTLRLKIKQYDIDLNHLDSVD